MQEMTDQVWRFYELSITSIAFWNETEFELLIAWHSAELILQCSTSALVLFSFFSSSMIQYIWYSIKYVIFQKRLYRILLVVYTKQ